MASSAPPHIILVLTQDRYRFVECRIVRNNKDLWLCKRARLEIDRNVFYKGYPTRLGSLLLILIPTDTWYDTIFKEYDISPHLYSLLTVRHI